MIGGGSFRKIRGCAYALMMVCGVVLPSQVWGETAHPFTWYLMCTWIVLGSILCALGQLSGRWTGEYVGLPLVFTALGGFGILQLAVSGWFAVPSVALLWAFTGLMWARWRDVASVFRASARHRRIGDGNVG